MILFKKAGDLFAWLEQQRSKGSPIGFVPTMGALHAGHISLIDISKKSTECTVCSIFVNPTQFNDPGDFQKYPVTLEKDIDQLERAGTDVLFLPTADEIYPRGMKDLEHYDLGRLETLLEGKYRPGHFQGVCQVMRRLLDLVRPDHLFMGQKDYQQCMVIRKLLEIMPSSATILRPCPIVREPDGLAMSSRNRRLPEAGRKKATAIYHALLLIREGWVEMRAGEPKGLHDGNEPGNSNQPRSSNEPGNSNGPDPGQGTSTDIMPIAIRRATSLLEENDFRIDYVTLADATTLEPIAGTGSEAAVALIAAFQGEVRLIDNMLMPLFELL